MFSIEPFHIQKSMQSIEDRSFNSFLCLTSHEGELIWTTFCCVSFPPEVHCSFSLFSPTNSHFIATTKYSANQLIHVCSRFIRRRPSPWNDNDNDRQTEWTTTVTVTSSWLGTTCLLLPASLFHFFCPPVLLCRRCWWTIKLKSKWALQWVTEVFQSTKFSYKRDI